MPRKELVRPAEKASCDANPKSTRKNRTTAPEQATATKSKPATRTKSTKPVSSEPAPAVKQRGRKFERGVSKTQSVAKPLPTSTKESASVKAAPAPATIPRKKQQASIPAATSKTKKPSVRTPATQKPEKKYPTPVTKFMADIPNYSIRDVGGELVGYRKLPNGSILSIYGISSGSVSTTSVSTWDCNGNVCRIRVAPDGKRKSSLLALLTELEAELNKIKPKTKEEPING